MSDRNLPNGPEPDDAREEAREEVSDDAVRDAFLRRRGQISAHVEPARGLDRIRGRGARGRLLPALGAAAVVIVAVGLVFAFQPFSGEEPAPATSGPVPTTLAPPTTPLTPPSTVPDAPPTTLRAGEAIPDLLIGVFDPSEGAWIQTFFGDGTMHRVDQPVRGLWDDGLGGYVYQLEDGATFWMQNDAEQPGLVGIDGSLIIHDVTEIDGAPNLVVSLPNGETGASVALIDLASGATTFIEGPYNTQQNVLSLDASVGGAVVLVTWEHEGCWNAVVYDYEAEMRYLEDETDLTQCGGDLFRGATSMSPDQMTFAAAELDDIVIRQLADGTEVLRVGQPDSAGLRDLKYDGRWVLLEHDRTSRENPFAVIDTAGALTPVATWVPDPGETAADLMAVPVVVRAIDSSAPVIDDGMQYRVTGVAEDDVLNVRQGPGTEFEIVGELAPDSLVDVTGFGVSNPRWIEVVLPGGGEGWASGAFLAPPSGWEYPLDRVDCQLDATDEGIDLYGGTQTVEPAGTGTGAGHVLEILSYSNAECDRFVLILGEDAGRDSEGSWHGLTAVAVPGGTSVVSGGSLVEVRIPGVTEVRPMASDLEHPAGFGFAGRDQAGLGDLTFYFAFDANRVAAIRITDSPARVIIDVKRAPTGSGLDVAPKKNRLTIVMPIQADINGPGLTLPFTVRGWARPFEASGIAILREAVEEEGTGALVEAVFASEARGVQITSTYGFSTFDYLEAWGAFEFTIDDLPAGRYELFVGDFDQESGDPEGVYQTFTVAP